MVLFEALSALFLVSENVWEIIAMINSTVNHSYDSRDDFNSTIEIIMRIKIPMESNHDV